MAWPTSSTGRSTRCGITDGVLDPSQFLFAAAPVDADFDNDQDVDGADFAIWQRNLGTAGDNSKGDADGNGQITGADLTAWKQRFGLPVAAAAAGAVPEPATLTLLAAAALFASASRFGRKTACVRPAPVDVCVGGVSS